MSMNALLFFIRITEVSFSLPNDDRNLKAHIKPIKHFVKMVFGSKFICPKGMGVSEKIIGTCGDIFLETQIDFFVWDLNF